MDAKTAKLFFIKEIVCFLLGEQKDTPSLSPDSSLNSDPPAMECQLELLQKGGGGEGAGLQAACSQAEHEVTPSECSHNSNTIF